MGLGQEVCYPYMGNAMGRQIFTYQNWQRTVNLEDSFSNYHYHAAQDISARGQLYLFCSFVLAFADKNDKVE